MAQEPASVTVQGQVENVPQLRRWLESQLSEWGVSKQAIADLTVAVTEICSNVARHGYSEKEPGDITLGATKEGSAVTVTIEDTAECSMPKQLPSLPDEPMAEGGYGQFLVQALVDEVSHRRLKPRGNRFLLVKYDQPAT
jgi:serine/threonine-protein kinase RsbW